MLLCCGLPRRRWVSFVWRSLPLLHYKSESVAHGNRGTCDKVHLGRLAIGLPNFPCAFRPSLANRKFPSRIMALLCITLLCFALLCIALHCFALLCIALLCLALLCVALLYCALRSFALICVVYDLPCIWLAFYMTCLVSNLSCICPVL